MNRVLILAATVLATSGCVNDSPLYVTGLFSLDPKNTGGCEEMGAGVNQAAGRLDLSGSGNYELLVALRSELDRDLDTKADNVRLVSGQQRNTVILDTINFTYTSSPTATIPTVIYVAESVPITLVIAPGGTANIRMGLLGQKAFEALNNAVVNAGDTSNVRVKFEFTGYINSGGRIKSSPITFPITVGRSGTTCPAGSNFCPTGACGKVGGQDGSPLVCSGAMGCSTK